MPGCPPDAAQTRPPNVILIVSDDAGFADFGFQGADSIRTPHLDRLAAEGVRFTNAYVTASVCSPSRAGLFTGRYQQRFGHEFNLVNRYPESVRSADWGLPLTEQTIGDRMRSMGYVTGMIGKWHLGLESHFHPNERGFDEFYGFLAGGRSYFPLRQAPDGARRMMRDLEPQPEPTYMTDDLTDAAVDFVQRHDQEPFFLLVSYNAPHTPMHATQEALDSVGPFSDGDRAKLAAMTWSLDDNIGRLLATVDGLGLGPETLVFFINDNGGAEINFSSNGSLRGKKGTKFEGGIRVPFLMRWSGTLPAGEEVGHTVSALDILPTALGVAGSQGGVTPGGRHAALDGLDLMATIGGLGAGPPDDFTNRDLFWRRGVAAAVRRGQWKLIRVDSVPPLLFDLAADPTEATDLASSEPDLVSELLGALDAWETGMTTPLWREQPQWSTRQIQQHRRRED